MPAVDVVVVSYNSRDRLRACVTPLSRAEGIHVIVVDNASTDRSLDAIQGLAVTAIERPNNGGFAVGCNVGWRAGHAPFVLFLNPDARIGAAGIRSLASVLERVQAVGLVAPRLVAEDGSLLYSRRHDPRIASSLAQALLLHRVFPSAAWVDEVVRDPEDYAATEDPDWVSGACVMLRRETLERLGGWDERFFLYYEDTDICRRVRQAGLRVRYCSSVVATHEGGASAPSSTTIPVLASSRLRYAGMHRTRTATAVERVAIVLGAVPRALVGPRGARAGHRRAIAVAMAREPVDRAVVRASQCS